jgi:hypothetical protein
MMNAAPVAAFEFGLRMVDGQRLMVGHALPGACNIPQRFYRQVACTVCYTAPSVITTTETPPCDP